MGERRGLNPRVVDSQSTALIHLATSAPTPVVSIYDQILSEPPYDRYQREAFSYTITIVVASLFIVFLELGEAKLQTKRLGCSLHWFDFTLLKIKDRGRAGSEGSFSRKQAPLFEASPHKRKPLHASLLYRVPNLRTPKLQASFEAPTLLIVGILEEASFYKPF